MNITKIVGTTFLVASMTSLFGATGGSDSDAGKKYNMAYIDCAADGNKKYIMDYVSTSGGFDFTKYTRSIKKSKKIECIVSGQLEIPYDVEMNKVDIKTNISSRYWNDDEVSVNGKTTSHKLAYDIDVAGNGKSKYVTYQFSWKGNYFADPKTMSKFLNHYSSLKFYLVLSPQKRGEVSKEITLKYFVKD